MVPMNQAAPPYIAYGVRLAQAGRRADALAYLRYAAYHEVMVAEAWLWLAAVTDDLEEYRVCVQEALRLQPEHATAQRMAHDLAARAGGGAVGPQARQGRRWGRIVLVLLVLVLGGLAAALVGTDFGPTVRERIEDALGAVDDSTGSPSAPDQSLRRVSFGRQTVYAFVVRVPDSWLPSDTGDPVWQRQAAVLRQRFPDATVWDRLGTDFAAAARDPVFGDVDAGVRIVETDPAALARDGLVTALTLEAIVPFPLGAASGDVCDAMRRVQAEAQAAGQIASIAGSEVVAAGIQPRPALDDCVFTIERRLTGLIPSQVTLPLSDAQAPEAMRRIRIAVPISAARYAIWELTLADSARDIYAPVINGIIASLAPASEPGTTG